jgi:hypothetical protein
MKSILWWLGVAVLGPMLGSHMGLAAGRQCTDPCLQAARGELRDCTSSATGTFVDALDSCVAGDRHCIDACRSTRQDCRDGTSLGEDLVACRLELAAAQESCRRSFEIGSIRRTICLDRAQAASSRCHRRSALRFARTLRDCRSAFGECTGACGAGEPPGGTDTCRADGRAAFKGVIAGCRLAHRVTASACINRDVTCVQECDDARATCTAPIRATLDAALATCTAQQATALAACAGANPAGSAALSQCVETARATASTCRDAALNAAAPGLEACAGPYVVCVRACPVS